MKHRFGGVVAGLAAGLMILASGRSEAGMVDDLRGHLAVGYAKLLNADAPGGSFSVAAGFDVPAATDLRVGIGLGFHLLGSRTVPRGSFVATVDYTVFDASLQLHWMPGSLGPVERVSIGPVLISAKADLSASAGGVAFGDLAVEEIAPGLAFDTTLMSRSVKPVRVGLEVGGRVAFLESENWSMVAARVAFHY